MCIDAHGLKIQGRGYLMFLPKSLGGSRLSVKIARVGEGLPILGFISFLLTSFLKICLGGAVSSPPPSLCYVPVWKSLLVWKTAGCCHHCFSLYFASENFLNKFKIHCNTLNATMPLSTIVNV